MGFARFLRAPGIAPGYIECEQHAPHEKTSQSVPLALAKLSERINR